tara:strand:- start:2904 stop:3761 length:858 start_codon:yes stop_codon:yes gene_type:complete
MNDGRSPEKHESKSWFTRLTSVISGEAENKIEVIDELRDARNRGLFNQETLAILEGALAVSDMQVREVMIPRTQMTAIRIDERPDEFLPRVIESAHSRFPVLGEQSSEVVGIILAKDLLPFLISQDLEKFEIKEVTRPVRRVPESKRLDQLLKEFRDNRAHMAVVIGEYGDVTGLITIEDVLEQIVGEIEDEHDHDEDLNVRHQTSGASLVKAITEIDDFNDEFGTNFSDEEFDTIGGFVTHAFGHLPSRGEITTIEMLDFIVLNSDSRKIRLLEVRPHEPSTSL